MRKGIVIAVAVAAVVAVLVAIPFYVRYLSRESARGQIEAQMEAVQEHLRDKRTPEEKAAEDKERERLKAADEKRREANDKARRIMAEYETLKTDAETMRAEINALLRLDSTISNTAKRLELEADLKSKLVRISELNAALKSLDEAK